MPRPFRGQVLLDIRNSKPDWDPFLDKKAPPDAPNVLVILYDDTGQAAWSPYGGRIEMPTLGSTREEWPDSGDSVSADYRGAFAFTGGTVVKVIYDVAGDAYLDAERHLAAVLARD
jgi:hypothetical protein